MAEEPAVPYEERDALDAATAFRIGLVSKVLPEDQLALNKMLINQAFENTGLRTTQMLGTFFDGMTRNTEEALRWRESFGEISFRETISRRDASFEDYGERRRQ